MSGVSPALTGYADRVARWAAIALGFSIPVSTAMDEFLIFALAFGVLVGGRYRAKFDLVRANGFGVAALAYFLLHVAGASYSMGGGADILQGLNKSSTILLVPLLIALSPDGRLREHALSAFMAASLLTLGLSYLLWFGLLPHAEWIKGISVDPVIFKKHITHGVLMALASYLFALKALEARGAALRAAFGVAATLAAFNVLYMANGRTGQLIWIALACYGLWCRFRWFGVALASGVCAAVAVTVIFATNNSIHHRAKATLEELRDWRAGRPATSDNMRPEVWRNSVDIVRRYPFLGAGTGGFAAAYAQQAQGAGAGQILHAENQYLTTAVQLGAVGLVALLALFAFQWHLAPRLATRADAALARGLVITMMIGCMFNSFLRDHTEALFYAWLTGLLYVGLRPRADTG